MYLKKFIYVNWGNIPHAEFDFGPINLFSGGNGSGKTTAADAIQTVMTAAHDNLFHFNPGQDESTQRGRGGKQVRTLASYVLGCDDGAYARPDACDGYLAAVFHPTPGEDAEAFTALLAMRAFVEVAGQQKVARLDDSQFFILPDVSLSLVDLVKEDKGGRYVLPMDRVYTLLRKQFGVGAVEKYDKKKAYLCRLYGVLRGRRDAVSEREAMNAARAFSRFMAYKPIKGIDEFVAQEVLEPRDLGDAIRDVSAMLKRIHNMESDARELREATERLQAGRDNANRFIDQWLEQQLLDYSLARSRYTQCQGRYLKEKGLQQSLKEQLQSNERDKHLSETRRRDIRERLLEVEVSRLQVPALRDKDQLEKGLAELEAQLTGCVQPLLSQDEQLRRNRQAAGQIQKNLQHTSLSLEIPELTDKTLSKTTSAVAVELASIDFQSLFNRDWIDISPLESHLDEALAQQQLHNRLVSAWFSTEARDTSLRDLLAQERDKRRQSSERLKRQVTSKEAEIQLLEQRQAVYPNYVRQALEALNRQLPEADARVLCDYVEVVDSAWQSAIEGYIGGARFGIIVEPDYEADAIRLLRQMSGGSRARVIQGHKAKRDADKLNQLHQDSILHVMAFGHSTAEAYITASYGQLQRVADAESLRSTRRGVTRECLGSGNYAMFRCDIDDSELVFGQAAREKALLAKQGELQTLQVEWQKSSDYANESHLLLQSVDQMKPVAYADQLQAMLAVQRKLLNAERSLKQLDLSDFDQLEQQLQQLKSDEQAQESRLIELENTRVEIRAKLDRADRSCKQLNEEQDTNLEQLETAEDNIRSLSNIWAEFNVEQQLAVADERVEVHGADYFEAACATLSAELNSELHSLQRRILEHNQLCQGADGLAFELDFTHSLGRANFKSVCDLQRQLDNLYNRYKNNILAKRYEELSSLRESFNNAFVTNLCHSIYQAINDGEKTLSGLNEELQHHRFGADRESFEFGWDWLPEFKEYWQFFKAVIDNPSLGDGETLFTMELSSKHEKVRNRLMAMLLDEDEHKAMRELVRIADYRNYRRYEIYKKPEGKTPIALSQYGTGSGGQLETPAYIIRSAAITSAFRFHEGKSHLRMVLVDEAFSKMDEHRSKEVIRYLTESLGLQLMFIMPSSKSGPFMDLISNQFIFSKCPTAEPVGELHTRVLVDRQQCDKEKIAALMANHRRTIRQQASLDFLEEVE
ncbi:AAA family ATPase [Aestuariicella hydrocarbonica]|uniref:AAA family ATPase n=1 Tax=Pseudomaricurvus hydrocarbonicus TaxID=1470433 RepID=A0A9E5JVQ5_9GAMM|nr:SbcC/MukB-like Walker B domain-containing protein [Aestuariicella hydrocarbonica]NHO65415.1 AAA family ATPase [Aestuariicella hydrocarbonica]